MKRYHWILIAIVLAAGLFHWFNLRVLEYLAYAIFGLVVIRQEMPRPGA